MHPLLPLLLLLLLTAACTGPATDRALHRAETLIATHPDSAAALLDSIAPHLGHSATRRAAHTALTAHARHRADLPQLPIDQLQRASQHYLLHPTPPTTPQALAHYQLGLAYQVDTLHARALTAYNHAAQTATQLHDHHLLGLIYRSIADIYTSIYCGQEALHYRQLSLQHFRQGSPEPYIHYAMLDLALAYNSISDHARGMAYADSLINIATETGNLTILLTAHKINACIAIEQNRFDDAVNSYRQTLNLTDTLDLISTQNLAISLLQLHRDDEAKHYLDKLLPKTAEYAYSDYHLHKGDISKAVAGLKHDIALQDSVIRHILTQNITSQIREATEAEAKDLRHQIAHHRLLWITVSIMAILAIVIITYTYHYRSLRKDKKISDTLIMAAELTQRLKDTTQALNHTTTKLDNTSAILSSTSAILNSNTRKLCTTSQTLQTIFSHQLTTLNSLCDALYSHSDAINPQQKHITQIIDFGRNPESLTQIEVALNLIHSNVIADFRKDFPKQPEKNVTLFLYITLKLSSRALSILLNTDIEKIYKQKNQLKTAIRNSDSQNRDFYLSFF